jgi:transcriptional regulator with XRE-family HTH domain
LKAYEIAPLRKRHGITQEELGRELTPFLRAYELGRIENGLIPVTDDFAEEILEQLQGLIARKNATKEVLTV